MLAVPERPFYITGGTLPLNASSYVERQADRELLAHLLAGEFCYVLDTRQMGKSSLMVRTAARLREQGATVAVLDLTAIGQNLTPEQWYDGLLALLGRQLDREEALEEFYLDNPQLGPLQRFMEAIRQVLLPALHSALIIFVDEIDVVRSLPFSAAEFFAGIRQCYNRRTQDSEFNRLTFCLLGVATPADLITDPYITPFNIGRRIELYDFTPEEAAPLTEGLVSPQDLKALGEQEEGREAGIAPIRNPRSEIRNRRLLERVLYWTNGHPYLTQRLCRALAERAAGGSEKRILPHDIDRICEHLFFTRMARETDDNLTFVRNRMLKSEADLGSLLTLFGRVRGAREAILDEEGNPLIDVLKLSGIVRVEEGRLRIRNRIYARIFNRDWITASLPDSELRHQRRLAREERRKRRIAEERELMVRRLLYAAHLNLAQQAWEASHLPRALELLEGQRPVFPRADLRGFEWRYLWRLCQGESLATLRGHKGSVHSVCFTPDGTGLVTGGWDGTIRLWRISTGQEVARFTKMGGRCEVSPDGKTLAALKGNSVILLDLAARQEIGRMTGHQAVIRAIAFSPDGGTLAVASGEDNGRSEETITLWEVEEGRERAVFPAHRGTINTIAFSPDGQTLATGSSDTTIKLWNVCTCQEEAVLQGHIGYIRSVAFSPDGKTLASGSWDNSVTLWDIAARQEMVILRGHTSTLHGVTFAPHGKLLASCSQDVTTLIWDLDLHQKNATLLGHTKSVLCVAFSPDSRTLATGSDDASVRLWHVQRRGESDILRGHTGLVAQARFSSDGRALATASFDHTVKLWEMSTQREITTLGGHTRPVFSVAFSAEGRILASGSDGWGEEAPTEIKIWDLDSLQEITTLAGHPNGTRSMVFGLEEATLITGGRDGKIKLWDLSSGTESIMLSGHHRTVNSIALSPDGRTLVSGSGDGRVKLWDLHTGSEGITLQENRGMVWAVAFAPNGKIVASGTADGIVRLWSVTTGREIATLKGHTGVVWSLAFSPDGKTLASSNQDQTVKLWSIAAQQEVLTLRGHTDHVCCVDFSPDETLLATGGQDTTVRLWRAAPFAETDS